MNSATSIIMNIILKKVNDGLKFSCSKGVSKLYSSTTISDSHMESFFLFVIENKARKIEDSPTAGLVHLTIW